MWVDVCQSYVTDYKNKSRLRKKKCVVCFFWRVLEHVVLEEYCENMLIKDSCLISNMFVKQITQSKFFVIVFAKHAQCFTVHVSFDHHLLSVWKHLLTLPAIKMLVCVVSTWINVGYGNLLNISQMDVVGLLSNSI